MAYSVVKYVGAAYLIYLGIRALMDGERFVLSETAAPALGLHRVYAQAVASDVFNPKIAVFSLAYLPQFADPTSGGGVALLQRSRSVGLDPHARESFKAT